MVNRALAWVAGIALAAGAGIVTVFIPADDAGADLFLVRAEIGERAEGRNIAATVHDVRLAEEITADDWHAAGNWLVVDLSAEAVTSQTSGILSEATLLIGDRVFTAVERGPLGVNLLDTQLIPGVARSGNLIFELPDDALASAGLLRLATGGGTWGDTILQVQIDLAEAERAGTVALAEVGWAAP